MRDRNDDEVRGMDRRKQSKRECVGGYQRSKDNWEWRTEEDTDWGMKKM